MAFSTCLIAIVQRAGVFSVHSQVEGRIDIPALERFAALRNVSPNSSYYDRATVLTRAELQQFLLSPTEPGTLTVHEWYKSLHQDIDFVLVHVAEWESGL